MTGRQHKAVAVKPARVLRGDFQVFGKQNRSGIGNAQRHSGVAGLGFFNHFGGQKADSVGHLFFLVMR